MMIGLHPKYVVTIACALLAGCADQTSVERVCGEGTEESEGVCRSVMACGAGTNRQGDECILSGNLVTCGSGTTLQDGVCGPTEPLTSCGEGTIEQSGECVPETPLVQCGSGTSLVGSECLPDNPLQCGADTEQVGETCVASVCGAGTIEDEGVCLPTQFAEDAGITGFIYDLARLICVDGARCNCSESGWDDALFEDQDYCEAQVRAQTMLYMVIWRANIVQGQLAFDEAEAEAFLAELEADDACLNKAFDIGPGEILSRFVESAAQQGEFCYNGLNPPACAEDGTVCRIPDDGEVGDNHFCLAPAAEGIICETDDDCQDSLFCFAEVDTCQPRRSELGSCATDRQCDDGLFCTLGQCQTVGVADDSCTGNNACASGLCCQDGTCQSTPGEGETCCSADLCQDEDTLYCAGDNTCTARLAEGATCDNTGGSNGGCDLDHICYQDPTTGWVCASKTPFCEWTVMQVE